MYNNFNRVPDRERARLGGSSYEEYSIYCIGGGSIYQNRRFADVVGSLPKCFDKQYFDVRVMIRSICASKSHSAMK